MSHLFRPTCAAAIVCGMLLTALPAHAALVNKILATVDGEPITLYQLKKFGERSMRGQQMNASMDQAQLLEALITDKIMEKEISEKGIVVRDEDIDRYIEG